MPPKTEYPSKNWDPTPFISVDNGKLPTTEKLSLSTIDFIIELCFLYNPNCETDLLKWILTKSPHHLVKIVHQSLEPSSWSSNHLDQNRALIAERLKHKTIQTKEFYKATEDKANNTYIIDPRAECTRITKKAKAFIESTKKSCLRSSVKTQLNTILAELTDDQLRLTAVRELAEQLYGTVESWSDLEANDLVNKIILGNPDNDPNVPLKNKNRAFHLWSKITYNKDVSLDFLLSIGVSLYQTAFNSIDVVHDMFKLATRLKIIEGFPPKTISKLGELYEKRFSMSDDDWDKIVSIVESNPNILLLPNRYQYEFSISKTFEKGAYDILFKDSKPPVKGKSSSPSSTSHQDNDSTATKVSGKHARRDSSSH